MAYGTKEILYVTNCPGPPPPPTPPPRDLHKRRRSDRSDAPSILHVAPPASLPTCARPYYTSPAKGASLSTVHSARASKFSVHASQWIGISTAASMRFSRSANRFVTARPCFGLDLAKPPLLTRLRACSPGAAAEGVAATALAGATPPAAVGAIASSTRAIASSTHAMVLERCVLPSHSVIFAHDGSIADSPWCPPLSRLTFPLPHPPCIAALASAPSRPP